VPRAMAVGAAIGGAGGPATNAEAKLALLTPDELKCPVWEHFMTLTDIPRPSGAEEAVLKHIESLAEERGLEFNRDAIGNLVVRRPASGVGVVATCPVVIVQNHVDVVTEKADGRSRSRGAGCTRPSPAPRTPRSPAVVLILAGSAHDFTRDPVAVVRDGAGWLGTVGTTLGADNGVGAAAAMALLCLSPDDPRPMPPLELLFTVDEEVGLGGAQGFDGSMVRGRILINLDTEEWGDVSIACAGGGDTVISVPPGARTPLEDPGVWRLLTIAIDGGLGGHSGLDIANDRAPAVRLVARVAAAALAAAGPAARLDTLVGGDKRNAIARSATARVVVPAAAADAARIAAEAVGANVISEFGPTEPDLVVSATVGDVDAAAVTPLDIVGTARLVSLLRALPHGAHKRSALLSGLVETSSNVASCKVDGDGHVVCVSTRSLMTPALEDVRDVIDAVATAMGCSTTRNVAYPGWAPRADSAVVEVVARAVAARLGPGLPGRDAVVVGGIHAGLECGILGQRIRESRPEEGEATAFPDMASFGPTIRGAHSPDERCEVATVGPFWEALVDILGELAVRAG